MSDFTLNQQIKLLWVLGCWEDSPEVQKQYEIKEQQINLLR